MNDKKGKCCRCHKDIWKCFNEIYNPSDSILTTYYLCKDCQEEFANMVEKWMVK